MPSTSRHRRQKLFAAVEVNEAEDRISNLPRNLIGHILSFLPTKYAVGTGILSTKWKWMWTSISNLDFDDEMLFYTANSSSNDERRQMSFLKFVYRVLLLLEGSNVNTFRIKCSPISNVSYVNSWVTAVLLRNVREVDICLPLGSSCLPLGSSVLLPTDLFCCDKLEVLKLDLEFVLNIPSLVDLKSLKTLHLSSVEFMDDESIKRLLSSCPVLEVLAFIECGGKNVSIVNISAPALKRLIVNHPASCWDTSIHENGIINTEAACPYEYQLNTPNLLYFAYMGWVAEGFDMNNLSSLVEASVDIDSCYEGQFYTSMAELLHGISLVQTLHLSGESFKTLETYASNRGSRLPVFHSLTTLELGEIHIGANWRLLPNLLECSPNLRTLGFEGLVDDYFDLNNFREWYTPERVPTCLSVTLEKINMGMFRGQENEVKVVEYFLTNAKVLKIMSIWFDQYQMPREQSNDKIFRKLLEMPRGSTSCKVMVTLMF